jgi:two-component system cell cycle sensor histidine kinase PleC
MRSESIDEDILNRDRERSLRETLALLHLETASRYLYTNLLPLPFVVTGMAVLLLQWSSARALAAWAALTLATWAVTLWTLRRFLNDAQRQARLQEWTVCICIAIFLATVAFGSAAVAFWVQNDRLNNILLYVVIAGGIASAGAQSAPSIPVAATNIAPYMIIFLCLSLTHEAFPVDLGVAFLQVCYCVLVLLYCRAVWQLTHEMLLLRVEKRSLITQLQGALASATAEREHAVAANRAKSDFLANMSHELRTPLNAVIGFSEVIKDRLFGPDAAARYAEYAADIHASGRHLLALINDVLDLSKIEAGKFELHETCFELVSHCREALRFVEPQAAKKGVRLAVDAPEPFSISADALAVRQIVVNLLSNAVKFTRLGGTVTLRVVQDPTDGVSIVVRDTGAGIREEDIGRVLESFQQGRHDVASTEGRGTGLGLAIVKGLAEAHGGTIDIKSKAGVGTTVTINLPATRIVAESGRSFAA